MTRAERRELNRRAHAIRRAIVREEWQRARAHGARARYRDLEADLETMTPAELVAAFGEDDPAPVTTTEPTPTRKPRRGGTPAHIVRAREAYLPARAAWEQGLADAVAGGSTRAEGGRPARGETYPDEERDYRAAHPAPVFRDFLAAEYAAMKRDRDGAAA